MLTQEVPQSQSFLIPLNRRKTKAGIYLKLKIPTALKNLHPKVIKGHVKALRRNQVKSTQRKTITSFMMLRDQKFHNKTKISIDSNEQREVYSKIRMP